MLRKFVASAASLFLLFALLGATASAGLQDSGAKTQISAGGSGAAKTISSKTSAVSASEIADAKASHKVWVNLDSGIYHKGGRWYGKTKNGKFMIVDEAKKAGYKAAKRD